jgi:hypothetical protein
MREEEKENIKCYSALAVTPLGSIGTASVANFPKERWIVKKLSYLLNERIARFPQTIGDAILII